ncbi:MAG: hypothetical protein C0606_08685 [Hyphomicrobiales bacterium]|nr:MAG: hypothetical protein C0606_08685 [Hyphomicrobiales bacterium]
MARFCGQCGEALGPGDRFCGTCGAPVEATADPPVPEPAPRAEPFAESASQAAMPASPAAPPRPVTPELAGPAPILLALILGASWGIGWAAGVVASNVIFHLLGAYYLYSPLTVDPFFVRGLFGFAGGFGAAIGSAMLAGRADILPRVLAAVLLAFAWVGAFVVAAVVSVVFAEPLGPSGLDLLTIVFLAGSAAIFAALFTRPRADGGRSAPASKISLVWAASALIVALVESLVQ